jgi:hypothetical protein
MAREETQGIGGLHSKRKGIYLLRFERRICWKKFTDLRQKSKLVDKLAEPPMEVGGV